MADLFDSDNYPTTEPEVIVIGDRWVWKRTDLGSTYAPSSYALSYRARLLGSGSTNFSFTASESGTEYIIEVASSTTTNYTAGTYAWNMYITRSSDSERIALDSGKFEVKTNLVTSEADPRTHAAKMVDYLEATQESLAQKLTSSYSITDRSNTLRSMDEVSAQLNYYRSVYNREVMKDRALSGRRTGQNILVRF
jgi:hypothetical protein|tara:strand:+ start:19 stop:603 length:585 start_codon:yes stop_codon:yes gene_type:complete